VVTGRVTRIRLKSCSERDSEARPRSLFLNPVRYVSTRSGRAAAVHRDPARGLAPDGGLFLPEEFPKLAPADLSAMRRMSYAELAFAIVSKFADDIPAGD